VERLQRKFTTIHSTLAQQQTQKGNSETPRASLSQSMTENLPKVPTVAQCNKPCLLVGASPYMYSVREGGGVGWGVFECPEEIDSHRRGIEFRFADSELQHVSPWTGSYSSLHFWNGRSLAEWSQLCSQKVAEKLKLAGSQGKGVLQQSVS